MLKAMIMILMYTCSVFHQILWAADSGEPVAMITDFQGMGQVNHDGTNQPAEILNNLYPGNLLKLENQAKAVVVFYASGKEYHYHGPTEVSIGGKAPAADSGLKNQPRDLNIILETGLKPNKHMSQAALMLRGGFSKKRKIRIIAPVNSKTLQTYPTFSWSASNETSRYFFTLTDESGNPVIKTVVGGSSFTLPTSVTLIESAWYSWEVGAEENAGVVTSSTAIFQMGTSKERKLLGGIRPKENSTFSQKVLYATILQQNGYHNEAQNYWEALSRLRPNSKSLKKLVKNK